MAPLLLSSVLYLPRLRGSHGEVILLDVHPWWIGSWNPPPAVAFPNERVSPLLFLVVRSGLRKRFREHQEIQEEFHEKVVGKSVTLLRT